MEWKNKTLEQRTSQDAINILRLWNKFIFC